MFNVDRTFFLTLHDDVSPIIASGVIEQNHGIDVNIIENDDVPYLQLFCNQTIVSDIVDIHNRMIKGYIDPLCLTIQRMYDGYQS
jgi:hypothetical protein